MEGFVVKDMDELKAFLEIVVEQGKRQAGSEVALYLRGEITEEVLAKNLALVQERMREAGEVIKRAAEKGCE